MARGGADAPPSSLHGSERPRRCSRAPHRSRGDAARACRRSGRDARVRRPHRPRGASGWHGRTPSHDRPRRRQRRSCARRSRAAPSNCSTSTARSTALPPGSRAFMSARACGSTDAIDEAPAASLFASAARARRPRDRRVPSVPVARGLDVLLARHRVTPVPMTARPELRARPRTISTKANARVPLRPDRVPARHPPHGPLHAGRGSRSPTARARSPSSTTARGDRSRSWPLAESADTPRRSRSFGPRSRIPEDVTQRDVDRRRGSRSLVTTLEEGAPKTIEARPTRRTDVTRSATRPPAIAASAGHLVLRAGGHEERRVLAHLDGETRDDKGMRLPPVEIKFLQEEPRPPSGSYGRGEGQRSRSPAPSGGPAPHDRPSRRGRAAGA